MDVLAIGNSFSQDATRYLHGIARAAGVELTVCNLYIGGCSLSRHYRNMLTGDRAYTLEINGQNTGFSVSLKEALLNRDWDFVTVQQVSAQSINYETFQPYLDKLNEFVRQCAPKAKRLVHATWAYEEHSHRLNVELGYPSRAEMARDVAAAYDRAASAIRADGVIPSGRLFSALPEHGITALYRDTFHASLGVGRYALGLLWCKVLTGASVLENPFDDFDEPVDADLAARIRAVVNDL